MIPFDGDPIPTKELSFRTPKELLTCKNALKVLMNFMKQRTIPNILQNFPSVMKLMHLVISLLKKKV